MIVSSVQKKKTIKKSMAAAAFKITRGDVQFYTSDSVLGASRAEYRGVVVVNKVRRICKKRFFVL